MERAIVAALDQRGGKINHGKAAPNKENRIIGPSPASAAGAQDCAG